MFLGRSRTDLCPVAAVLGYLAIRGAGLGPLFVFADGRWLTRRRFVTQVREAVGINQSNTTVTVSEFGWLRQQQRGALRTASSRRARRTSSTCGSHVSSLRDTRQSSARRISTGRGRVGVQLCCCSVAKLSRAVRCGVSWGGGGQALLALSWAGLEAAWLPPVQQRSFPLVNPKQARLVSFEWHVRGGGWVQGLPCTTVIPTLSARQVACWCRFTQPGKQLNIV